jgi:hypothetical protein
VSALRFPTDCISGDCFMPSAEITTGTVNNRVYEVALNADSRICFEVELSGLKRYSRGAYFTRYRVSRRMKKEKT